MKADSLTTEFVTTSDSLEIATVKKSASGASPAQKRRLKWAKVDYLSLCPRGANRMGVVYKDDDPERGTFAIESLTKEAASFDEKGEILAVGYPVEHRDAQGDIADADVVKELCYSFAQAGNKLDLRHNNQVIPRERAFVAENFLVQKTDSRFHGWKDNQGQVVDLTGSWGVVLKVEDPELRKLYRNGGWNGVSFEGRVGFVVEKETNPKGEIMDFEKLLKAIQEGNQALVATLTKEIKEIVKPAAPAPVKKEDEEPKFSGDPTNVDQLRKHLVAVRRYKLVKSVDLSDPDQLAAAIEQIEQEQVAARAKETPDQKAERLTKENLDLLARVKKAERSSNQSPIDSTAPSADAITYAGGETIKKSDLDLGKSIADIANRMNGSAKK